VLLPCRPAGRQVGRTNVTVAGDGTKDEMCLGFINYWPKLKQPNVNICLTAGATGRVAVCGHTSQTAAIRRLPTDAARQQALLQGLGQGWVVMSGPAPEVGPYNASCSAAGGSGGGAAGASRSAATAAPVQG